MALVEDDPDPGVPQWVVTYGDMMSLLLTFFIMLVSMSELKQDGKVRAMLDGIREAFGASLGEMGIPGSSLQSTSMMRELSSKGNTSEGGEERSGRDSDGRAGPYKTAQRIGHGTVVTLGGPSLFQRFDATLSPHLEQNLDLLAEVVGERGNFIVVRGYATREPLPAGSPFRDPLDLSFARAQAAAEHLVARGIDRRRIRVSAAGDAEPRVVTRQKRGQRLNRRVDVFLLDTYIAPP